MLNCLPGQFKHLVSLLPGLSPEAAGRLGRVIEHILAAEAVDGGNNFDRNLLNFLQGEIIKIPKTNL